tara:strand:+ start:4010 stop:5056 length:1047 start_codon:yes stop_codon:yes gene_type:complete
VSKEEEYLNPKKTITSRRLRLNPEIRKIFKETTLNVDNFIAPIFVCFGENKKIPIQSMPNQYQISIDKLEDEIFELKQLGISSVILFGIPEKKDFLGSDNFSDNGIVPSAIRIIKNKFPEIIVISDLCFCEYTDHGHCGVINLPEAEFYQPNLEEGYLLNQETLKVLNDAALIHANAGADIIAPSGMIDGTVRSLRTHLDTNGFEKVAIMNYSVKYKSSLYEPFRDAAESSPSFGDRSQYQMDFSNRREAIKKVKEDYENGVDIIMVKPAMFYQDVIRELRDNFELPICAYQVSGEYSMIHNAASNNLIDLNQAILESLLSIKRSGADLIITYFAKEISNMLKQNGEI